MNVAGWAEQHGTPFYLAHTDRVAAEMDRLRSAFRRHHPNTELAYSVKTNYLPSLVRNAHDAGHRIEVVSRHELAYVRELGIPDDQIVFNGPGKTLDDLSDAHRTGVLVNLDSSAELAAAAKVGEQSGQPMRVGLRIAARLTSGDRSRFGVVPELVKDSVNQLCSEGHVEVVGLHIHHSSDRSAASFGTRVCTLAEAAHVLGLTALEFIDIGGGLASALPDRVREQLGYDVSTFDEYAHATAGAIEQAWGADRPTLLLEPGTATLSSALSYVTRVVSRRAEDAIAVVDGTMFEVNPLRSRVEPPIDLLHSRSGDETQLFGGTCMEIDVLGSVAGTPEVGDLVILTNVGAYTLVLSPEFIVARAPVVDAVTGEVLRARQATGDLGGFR